MSQQQRDLVYTILDASPVDIGGDAVTQRPLLEQVMTAQPLPDDVSTTAGVLGGVPAVHIDVAANAEAAGVILYLHGGAYALGSAASAVGLASGLARAAGTRAVAIEYRLAPEHPYPAAVEDVLAAYRALLEQVPDAQTIAIAGDSAGAGLAAAALVAIGRAGLPQPAAAVLMSPWADLTLSGDSLSTKASADHVLTAAGLRVRAREYVGTADPADPLVSPVHADLAGLPPVLVQAGSDEILLDDAVRLAARAAADDVAVVLDVTPRVPHIFQVFAGLLDEADAALARAGAFLRARMRA